MSAIEMIPVARPLLGEAEADAARDVILSGWVTQGPAVAAFEREFAAYVGAEHACAVANCTVALHLALVALGVGHGDEVVTVSHSFIATANAVHQCGAVPVFVDIEEGGFNIDPELVEAAITPRTKAIICVHQIGMPCDLARLSQIARRRALPLIEDAACAAGSRILHNGVWETIGRPHGDIACFSFHPRKVITTGEGGMLTTADPSLDAKFRQLRQHGMSVSDTVRHGSPRVIFEEYPATGFNYRITDIQAAIGRAQLTRIDGIVAKRRRIAARYGELLSGIEGLVTPREPAWAQSNFQSYCVRLPDGVCQRTVMQALLDRCISTRRGIMNIHRERPYAGSIGDRCELPMSVAAQERSIIIPLFAQMSDADVERVASAFGEVLEDVGRRSTMALPDLVAVS